MAFMMRRIEAVCGPEALRLVQEEERELIQAAGLLKAGRGELVERLTKMLKRTRDLEKEVSARDYTYLLSLLNKELSLPGADRLLYLAEAFRRGMSLERAFELTRIDPWFLENIRELVDFERELAGALVVDFVPLRRSAHRARLVG